MLTSSTQLGTDLINIFHINNLKSQATEKKKREQKSIVNKIQPTTYAVEKNKTKTVCHFETTSLPNKFTYIFSDMNIFI